MKCEEHTLGSRTVYTHRTARQLPELFPDLQWTQHTAPNLHLNFNDWGCPSVIDVRHSRQVPPRRRFLLVRGDPCVSSKHEPSFSNKENLDLPLKVGQWTGRRPPFTSAHLKDKHDSPPVAGLDDRTKQKMIPTTHRYSFLADHMVY